MSANELPAPHEAAPHAGMVGEELASITRRIGAPPLRRRTPLPLWLALAISFLARDAFALLR